MTFLIRQLFIGVLIVAATPAAAAERMTLQTCGEGSTGQGAVCIPAGLGFEGTRPAGRSDRRYYGFSPWEEADQTSPSRRNSWAQLGSIAMRYQRTDDSQSLDVVLQAAPLR